MGRVPGRTLKERASVLLSLAASEHAAGRGISLLELSDRDEWAAENLAYRALEAVKDVDPVAYANYLSTPDACALAQAMLENGEVK